MNAALEDMLSVLHADPDRRFTPADIERWAGSLDNDPFFNSAALEIARKYHAQQLSYTVGDSLMNDLWRAFLEGIPRQRGLVPEPFYSVYLAFDAVEYFRTEYRSDDPVVDHTDPWIAEILQENPQNPCGSK